MPSPGVGVVRHSMGLTVERMLELLAQKDAELTEARAVAAKKDAELTEARAEAAKKDARISELETALTAAQLEVAFAKKWGVSESARTIADKCSPVKCERLEELVPPTAWRVGDTALAREVFASWQKTHALPAEGAAEVTYYHPQVIFLLQVIIRVLGCADVIKFFCEKSPVGRVWNLRRPDTAFTHARERILSDRALIAALETKRTASFLDQESLGQLLDYMLRMLIDQRAMLLHRDPQANLADLVVLGFLTDLRSIKILRQTMDPAKPADIKTNVLTLKLLDIPAEPTDDDLAGLVALIRSVRYLAACLQEGRVFSPPVQEATVEGPDGVKLVLKLGGRLGVGGYSDVYDVDTDGESGGSGVSDAPAGGGGESGPGDDGADGRDEGRVVKLRRWISDGKDDLALAAEAQVLELLQKEKYCPNIPRLLNGPVRAREALECDAFVMSPKGVPVVTFLRQCAAADGPVGDVASVVSKWIVTIAKGVGAALDHAHALRLVHCDVRPENIVLVPSAKRAVLVDWGLSFKEDTGFTGGLVGTVNYAADAVLEGGGSREMRFMNRSYDFESLAYTLAALTHIGRPPWNQAVVKAMKKAEADPKPRRGDSVAAEQIIEARGKWITEASKCPPLAAIRGLKRSGKLESILATLRDDAFSELVQDFLTAQEKAKD